MSATERWFLAVGRAEAASFLCLLLIAMPLKYALGRPEAVAWVGWLHGILFLIYVVAVGSLARVAEWPWSRIALGLLAALVPLGPLALEWHLGRTRAA